MEGVKIYGLCLERLKYQITKAKERIGKEGLYNGGPILLESYNTGELDEIIDILELYDVRERTFPEVKEKLSELAYTVSELVRKNVIFDYTDEGHLGLYVMIQKESLVPQGDEVLA